MEKDPRKELKVSAIENGTVIDHIPSRSLFQVVRILNLEKYESQILVGMNLDSRKYGRKGILKISNKFFRNDEINKIALAAPTATMIVIRDFQVVEKRAVEIPDEVIKIVKCFNPNCITNHEKITTRFNVINKEELRLQCHYCEKITAKDNMVFI
ncbi:MAG TPA: aspartate carbamoyltransferase regulatory subunit [Bacteroidales bacterium]|nr:aspartate carbamoyltransferase regulatory subunit [Bacteroidales bacterium]